VNAPRARSNAQVLPVDDTGTQTTDVPQGIRFGSDDIGWLYGVYLQDEWKVSADRHHQFRRPLRRLQLQHLRIPVSARA
jgi:hypothetical protein